MTAARRVVQAPPPWPGEGVGAETVIRALHQALWTALVPRADGSRHHINCINRHVNAIPRECSKACQFANGALLLAQDWSEG